MVTPSILPYVNQTKSSDDLAAMNAGSGGASAGSGSSTTTRSKRSAGSTQSNTEAKTKASSGTRGQSGLQNIYIVVCWNYSGCFLSKDIRSPVERNVYDDYLLSVKMYSLYV